MVRSGPTGGLPGRTAGTGPHGIVSTRPGLGSRSSRPRRGNHGTVRHPRGYQASFKKIWGTTLERAGVAYFRIYDLRSTYATRLSAGGVADEWVTQLLRQSDAKVFKKYSQMKLAMKREALRSLNRRAGEERGFDTLRAN